MGNRSEVTATLMTDPVYQEYIRFRCEDWAEWHRFISQVMNDANPAAVLSTNCGVFSWQNTVAQMGLYLPLIAPEKTFIFIEDGHNPGLRNEGVISHRVRDYKIASSLGLRCIAFSHQYDVPYLKRTVCESMVFNGGVMGHINTDDDVNARLISGQEEKKMCSSLVNWRRKNADLFEGRKPAADVAILRNFESLAFDCFTPLQQTMLAEETLLHKHIPFEIIFNEQIDSLKDMGIKTLIIASQSCLSDEIAEKIVSFHASGGNLLIIGQSGSRTEHAVLRQENVLMKLLGLENVNNVPSVVISSSLVNQNSETSIQFESVFSDSNIASHNTEWSSHSFCAERLIYIPELKSSIKKEIWYPHWQLKNQKVWDCYEINGDKDPVSRYAKEYAFINWRLPVNAGQLIDAIQHLSRPRFIMNVPDTVFVNHISQPEKSRELIFFVNYANQTPVYAASVFLHGNFTGIAEFRAFDPTETVIQLESQTATQCLALPQFKTLGVLILPHKTYYPENNK